MNVHSLGPSDKLSNHKTPQKKSQMQFQHLMLLTFQFIVLRVCRKQDVGEKLLEAVAGVPRPVLDVGPHRLVELHQELLRRRPQLLDHLVPLVNILWLKR